MIKRGTVLLILLGCVIYPGRAGAESSVPLCADGNTLPYSEEIPANIPSFVVEPQGIPSSGPESVTLLRVEGEREVVVEAAITARTVIIDDREQPQYVVVPAAELVVGREHVLRFDPCAIDGVVSERRYRVVAAVPLPDAPARITFVPEARVGGTWIREVRLLVHLDSATTSLEPWYTVLDHRVSVGSDIHLAPSFVSGTRMTFQFAMACGTSYSGGPVGEGTHALHGSFAGWGLNPFVEVLEEVTLDCDDLVYVDLDGRPLTPEQIAAIGTVAGPGPTDRLDGAPGLDGAVSSDAGTIDPDTLVSGPEPASSACSVSHGTSGASVIGALVSVLAAATARSRRRRARRPEVAEANARHHRSTRGNDDGERR
jgi:hypothetical protein